MLQKTLFHLLYALLMVGLGSGCDHATSHQHGQKPFPVVTSGQITQITGHSLTVRGYTFDAAQSKILVRGTDGSLDDLKPGMVVTVKGTVSLRDNTGVAQSIDYQTLAVGPVSAIFPDEKRITVLDQPVWLADSTLYQGTSLGTLAIGDILEINGFLGEDGIHATYIKLSQGSLSRTITITGVINSLDPAAMTFLLGSLPVNYSNAQLAKSPAGGLQDGLLITVSGIRLGDVLMANHIKVLARLGGDIDNGNGPHLGNDNISVIDVPVSGSGSGSGSGVGLGDTSNAPIQTPDIALLEGIIRAINPDGSIVVGDTLIVLDAATLINSGNFSELGIGTFVSVAAHRGVDGAWLADIINIQTDDAFQLESQLDGVDLQAMAITLNGLTLNLDPAILVTSANPDVDATSLSALYIGAPVRISGFISTDGTLSVTRITLLPTATLPSGRLTLNGIVTYADVDMGALTIGPLTLRVTAATLVNVGYTLEELLLRLRTGDTLLLTATITDGVVYISTIDSYLAGAAPAAIESDGSSPLGGNSGDDATNRSDAPDDETVSTGNEGVSPISDGANDMLDDPATTIRNSATTGDDTGSADDSDREVASSGNQSVSLISDGANDASDDPATMIRNSATADDDSSSTGDSGRETARVGDENTSPMSSGERISSETRRLERSIKSGTMDH